MTQLHKLLTTVVLSVVLFVGFLFAPSLNAVHAAITPDEAKGIIRDSNSLKEAGENLREADSAAKVRQGFELDTAKEVRDRKGETAVPVKNKDGLIEQAEEKIKETAENVKEKLNLDEPLAPSTKEFLGKRKEVKEPDGKVVVEEKPGYYQRDRQTEVFVEDK